MATTIPLLSEVDFDHRATDGFPVTCPTLDLTAIWESGGKNLLITRPPGQIVSKIHQVGQAGEKAPDVLAVRWKPDGTQSPPRPILPLDAPSRLTVHIGQFLAVGWSDGVVRLMGLESNKAAHHIKVCGSADNKIVHIAWVSCNIYGKQPPASSENLRKSVAADFGQTDRGCDLDLPQELTFVEVDTALPRISPLPSASAGAG